jgi:translation initiation factor 1
MGAARKDPGDRSLAWSSDGTARPGATPRVPAPSPKGVVRVRLERQGRGGKTVTVVDGLPGHPAAIDDLARRLKSACAAGGTVRGRAIEIQGDHRDRVVAFLEASGVPSKRAGG